MKRLEYDPIPIEVPIAGHLYRIYHPANRESLRAQHPTWWWMYTWAAGILLSLELAKLDKKKTILDIGCGLGLASVVASRLGHTITCTDVIEETEWFVELTASSSETKAPLWLPVSEVVEKFDMIMFSDILYANFRDLTPFFQYMIDRLAAGGEILCIEQQRPEFLKPAFSVLSQLGLQIVSEEKMTRPQFTDSPIEFENTEYVKYIIKKNITEN